MNNPDDWGQWPFCSMKRHIDHDLECGVVVEGHSIVYIANLFRLDKIPGETIGDKLIDNDNVKRYVYESWKEMLEDGWVVD